jgi:hypothetical protein
MAMNPRQAEKSSHEPVEETFRSATGTGHEGARKTTEQMEQTAQAMADASRQATTATSDAIRGSAERAGDVWRSGSAIGSRIAERSMEQCSRLLGLAGGDTQQTVQRSFRNLQAIAESGGNIADGFRNASAEWMAFAQNSIEHNFDRMNALMGCRSIDECVAMQTEFMRHSLVRLLQSARRTSEISAQAAEEAARRMNQASSLAPR